MINKIDRAILEL